MTNWSCLFFGFDPVATSQPWSLRYEGSHTYGRPLVTAWHGLGCFWKCRVSKPVSTGSNPNVNFYHSCPSWDRLDPTRPQPLWSFVHYPCAFTYMKSRPDTPSPATNGAIGRVLEFKWALFTSLHEYSLKIVGCQKNWIVCKLMRQCSKFFSLIINFAC